MAAGRIAVVGAGLAGLSAAVALQQRGYEVEIFERSRLLGGKATSYAIDGIEVDSGQHVYLGCCSAFIAFVAELGLSDSLWLQPHFEVLLLRRGAPACRLRAGALPAPLHLLPVLLNHAYLNWADKLQVMRAIAAARACARGDESFAEWLARHGQSARARRVFWDPFFVPALNAPLEAASAAAGCFVINTAFAGDRRAACIGFARVPLARIAEAAAARAAVVHLRTAVTGVLVARGRVQGVCVEGREARHFDAVVLAVPPHALRRLLGEAEPFGLAELEAFRSEPIVDVHLWYDRAELGFDFAALVDSPVQWVFQKGPGYLCCSLSAAHELVSWPRADLIALCERELGAALPALASARLQRAVATCDPHATFVPAPGLRRPGPATSVPNLAIAGAWTDTGWPATMESAVRSGQAAARWIAEREACGAA